MSRSKIIRLDERFEGTGEPTVQIVARWGRNGRPLYERLSKEASASPAMDYMKYVQPDPNRTVVLILGLGSYEYYGLNRNGDGFNEQPYRMGQSNGPGRDAWVMEKECIQHHFHTYEQGLVYRHHVNKDPKKAVGKVLKAFWNPLMHRVEVLEDLDNRRAPDLAAQIDDGQFPAKSMGCRIKFDVCTQCGNMAPTRAQYCDHLKFEMSRLDPITGIRAGALNPSPRFFDSSWVLRPADRTGYMLKKVAEDASAGGPYELWSSADLGDYVDHLEAKSAAARKLSMIDKVVRGYPAAMVQGTLPAAGLIEKYRNSALHTVVENTPELSAQDLEPLSKHNLADVLSALSRAGIILTTPEFLQMFLQKALPGVEIPPDVLDQLTAMQGELFELFGDNPSLLDQALDAFVPEGEPTELKEATLALREKRSTVSDYLYRRMMPPEFRSGQGEPNTDLMEVVDPGTGQTRQTTRGAALAAHDAIAEAELKKMLGGGAMLAAAYKVLTAHPDLKPFKLPIGAGLGYAGYKTLPPDMGPTYKTTGGEEVPYLTEFAEKQGFVHTVNSLGQDYQVTPRGMARFERALSKTAKDGHWDMHRVLRKLAAFGVYPGDGLAAQIAAATRFKLSSDGIVEAPLNFDKVAEVIGTLVWGRAPY